MKKILFLLLPLLLSACLSKPAFEEKPKIDPIISNEVTEQPTIIPAEKVAEKPVKEKPPVKKTETTPDTETDPQTDDMAKELDSLIDEIIGG